MPFSFLFINFQAQCGTRMGNFIATRKMKKPVGKKNI